MPLAPGTMPKSRKISFRHITVTIRRLNPTTKLTGIRAVSNANMISHSTVVTRGTRGASLLNSLLLGCVLSTAASVAGAQSAAPDDSLTWHGITLYGIVDVGLQNQSHGAPINDYFVAGSADIVQKNSNHSITGVTPSNLSQSRIGLQGAEPIVGDWMGVFKLETFFNPQSGDISDALKSLAQNNGRSLANQTTNLDSSVAGQVFQQSFAGFSSKSFGTITFGRQNTVLADGVAKYDPNFASQAFSLIGLSGTTAGGGDTQNRRMDSSLKYVGTYGMDSGGAIHLNAEYKFNQAYGGASTAFEVAAGGGFSGFSGDVFYTKINDAVSVAALSAAQVGDLAGLCPNPLPSHTAQTAWHTERRPQQRAHLNYRRELPSAEVGVPSSVNRSGMSRRGTTASINTIRSR